MAERNESRDETWDDLSPEAVRRMWEQIVAEAGGEAPMCLHCVNMVWPKRWVGDVGYRGDSYRF